MELITQLLLNKFAQDRATKDRDAGWAREDAYRAQQREDRLAQNEYMRGVEDRRLAIAEDASQRAGEQMAANNALMRAGLLKDPDLRITQSIGGMAQQAMMPPRLAGRQAQAASYSDPQFGSTGVGETLASRAVLPRGVGGGMPGVGIHGLGVVQALSPEEIQAREGAAEAARFERLLRQVGRMGTAAQEAAGSTGRVVSRVGSDGYTLANPLQPRVTRPPTVPVSEQTLRREADASAMLRTVPPEFQRIADATGGSVVPPVPSDLTKLNDGQLRAIALRQAKNNGVAPEDMNLMVELMTRRLAEERAQQIRAAKGGATGESETDKALREAREREAQQGGGGQKPPWMQ